MNVRASVVVPVFGTEEYLPGCLQSLIDQTFNSFEIIVVDDCSPGDCKSIVRQYQSVNPNIHYIRHERNLGILAARLTGIELSNGQYVAHLDSDDVAKPSFIEVLLETATATGADIIGSLSQEVESSSRFEIRGTEGMLTAYVNRTIQNYNVWTKMYRRDFVLGIEYMRELSRARVINHAEDLLFNVLCALDSPLYINVPQALVEYRRDRLSSCSNILDSSAVLRKIEQIVFVYETLRSCAGEHLQLVERLISSSAAANYRNTLARCDSEDLRQILSWLQKKEEGAMILSYMLMAGESDRRRIIQKSESTKKKLSTLRKRLREEKLAAQYERKRFRERRAKFSLPRIVRACVRRARDED